MVVGQVLFLWLENGPKFLGITGNLIVDEMNCGEVSTDDTLRKIQTKIMSIRTGEFLTLFIGLYKSLRTAIQESFSV